MAAMALDLPTLLRAYAVGLFPMADDREATSLYWVQPERRAILPLDGFCLSRSLRKTLRADRFTVTADRAFVQVISGCAESTAGRPSTWINPEIERAFVALHRQGLAHSIECWREADGEGGDIGGRQLVGGLYGLALGRAFFGESMFSRARDASKVAMAWLVARLRVGGYQLLDCQFMTPHLASLGAIEISSEDYSGLLAEALADGPGAFEALDGLTGAAALPWSESPESGAAFLTTRTVSGPVSGQVIAQLVTQTS